MLSLVELSAKVVMATDISTLTLTDLIGAIKSTYNELNVLAVKEEPVATAKKRVHRNPCTHHDEQPLPVSTSLNSAIEKFDALSAIKDDGITCLECGHEGKVLKQHLTKKHQMTTEEYKEKYHIPKEIPLVSNSYHQSRSQIAFSTKLGSFPRAKKNVEMTVGASSSISSPKFSTQPKITNAKFSNHPKVIVRKAAQMTAEQHRQAQIAQAKQSLQAA